MFYHYDVANEAQRPFSSSSSSSSSSEDPHVQSNLPLHIATGAQGDVPEPNLYEAYTVPCFNNNHVRFSPMLIFPLFKFLLQVSSSPGFHQRHGELKLAGGATVAPQLGYTSVIVDSHAYQQMTNEFVH